eukprot:160309-Lingulodinium_polyedra.AAC.1
MRAVCAHRVVCRSRFESSSEQVELSAFPAQTCLQICSGTPHGATDSKHHSTMLDTMRAAAHGVEH